MANADFQNIPSKFNLLRDFDSQERRLHAIFRNLYLILDELKLLRTEVAPKRIVDAEAETDYTDSLDDAKDGIKAAIVAITAIDALE